MTHAIDNSDGRGIGDKIHSKFLKEDKDNAVLVINLTVKSVLPVVSTYINNKTRPLSYESGCSLWEQNI